MTWVNNTVLSLESSMGVTVLYRSKLKVNTGFRSPALKRSLKMPAEKSSSAGGTTSNIRVDLFANNMARSGPTTVVLPAPMIIW